MERWREFYNSESKDVTPEFIEKIKKFLGRTKLYHRDKKATGLIIYIPLGDVAEEIYNSLRRSI